jgi:hypothetical protein
MHKRDASQVVTFAPDGSDARWLGEVGNVSGLQYGYVVPGGCDQMQCQLQTGPVSRVRALEQGRVMGIYRGASRVWDGKLDMPTPSSAGWQVNAHGSGQFGGDYMAYWATSWEPDDVINQAITNRGLRWVNPGLNSTSGLYLLQPQDSASVTITSMLNTMTQPGNLIWYVGRGNRISITTVPTTPTNLLLTSAPAARTLQGYYDELWLRYEISADGATSGNAAVYGTTSYTNTQQAARHGQLEIYADLSAAGVMSAGAAQTVGQNSLTRYQASSFAGPFTVPPGQLLTLGGSPIDLGVGMPSPIVCQLVIASNSYGGEVVPTPPLYFLAGGYTFYDDTQSAQLTPFQYAAQDLATLLSSWVTINTPPAPAS